MSKVNALWQDTRDQVFDDLVADNINIKEAVERLHQLGYERVDAHDELSTVYASEHHQP